MLMITSPATSPVSATGDSVTAGSSVLKAAMRLPERSAVASGGGRVVVVVVIGHSPSRRLQTSVTRSMSRGGLPVTTTDTVIFFRPGFRLRPLSGTATLPGAPHTGAASVGLGSVSVAPLLLA